MDDHDPLKKIKETPQNYGKIIWNSLTPSERELVLKRIKKGMPEIQTEIVNFEGKPSILIEKKSIEMKSTKSAETVTKETVNTLPFERSVWNMKTMYQVAFADMIEQRTTIMKFLLDNYGIEVVKEFFLHKNPEWAEKLKVGKIKKIFAKLISKLAPHILMNKLSDIIIENAQYLVPLDHISLPEVNGDHKIIEIEKCPVLKQFRKTIKILKFSNLEERYICTFGCIPVISQIAAIGNCNVVGEYNEKGCNIIVTLKPKESELIEPSEGPPVKNAPS